MQRSQRSRPRTERSKHRWPAKRPPLCLLPVTSVTKSDNQRSRRRSGQQSSRRARRPYRTCRRTTIRTSPGARTNASSSSGPRSSWPLTQNVSSSCLRRRNGRSSGSGRRQRPSAIRICPQVHLPRSRCWRSRRLAPNLTDLSCASCASYITGRLFLRDGVALHLRNCLTYISFITISEAINPMILLLGGEKGGTGKSCLAQNLAVWIQARGGDVLLLDADPQGTTADWAEERSQQSDLKAIPVVQAQGQIRSTLTDLQKRYRQIVVDAGGADSEALRSAMTVATHMLIPFSRSGVT
uniref:CobQ/CobB/MinD/ParA nucleotide binding domain-containing protein n=1 Tax=Pseudomonas aeruginosa TaxID=287 RepID=Q51556_PSEAI|nr:unknown [Pseudomonas aeruginosa PAO1]